MSTTAHFNSSFSKTFPYFKCAGVFLFWQVLELIIFVPKNKLADCHVNTVLSFFIMCKIERRGLSGYYWHQYFIDALPFLVWFVLSRWVSYHSISRSFPPYPFKSLFCFSLFHRLYCSSFPLPKVSDCMFYYMQISTLIIFVSTNKIPHYHANTASSLSIIEYIC